MGTEFILVDHDKKEYIWLGNMYYKHPDDRLFQMKDKYIVNFLEDRIGHSLSLKIGDNWGYEEGEKDYKEIGKYSDDYEG